ncbi:MAG: hypothetical protein OEY92_00050 [Elusimicrobiota bacterium]|nr:hypothetical protein [Elusimicrobiota bacterium]
MNSVAWTVYGSVWLQWKFPGEARAVQELKLKTARVPVLKDYR